MYNSSTQKRITYQWLKSQKSGTLEFAAPQEPGTYEFQMWIQNWKSKAATSNKVVIKWGPVGLKVDVGDADAQEKRRIHIEFTGAPGYRDDTIGIFRAGTTTKLKYQYLNGAKDGNIEIGGIDENELIEVQLWGNSWRKMLAKTQPFIPKNGPRLR